jgi:hypothetical protein
MPGQRLFFVGFLAALQCCANQRIYWRAAARKLQTVLQALCPKAEGVVHRCVCCVCGQSDAPDMQIHGYSMNAELDARNMRELCKVFAIFAAA